MSDPLPHALPYGLRDVKLTSYTDGSNTVLGIPVDLPVARTLSFTEAEEFNELEGDDETVATHGAGPKVEWELESGGISFAAWAVMSGATYTPGATARVLKKNVAQSRPYFKIEGQVISDSGGDIHCEIFRAKADDSLEGEFAYGEFMLTAASGKGYGSQLANPTGDETTEVNIGDLYRFVQNDTVKTISALLPGPTGLSSVDVTTTTVDLEWIATTPVPSTGYKVYQRVWTSGGTNPWVASTTTPANGTIATTTAEVTGLTLDTHYEFYVVGVNGTTETARSNTDDATTAAA
jgi:hypothetical protein